MEVHSKVLWVISYKKTSIFIRKNIFEVYLLFHYYVFVPVRVDLMIWIAIFGHFYRTLSFDERSANVKSCSLCCFVSLSAESYSICGETNYPLQLQRQQCYILVQHQYM